MWYAPAGYSWVETSPAAQHRAAPAFSPSLPQAGAVAVVVFALAAVVAGAVVVAAGAVVVAQQSMGAMPAVCTCWRVGVLACWRARACAWVSTSGLLHSIVLGREGTVGAAQHRQTDTHTAVNAASSPPRCTAPLHVPVAASLAPHTPSDVLQSPEVAKGERPPEDTCAPRCCTMVGWCCGVCHEWGQRAPLRARER